MIDTLLAYIPYTIAAIFTPGPNNIMVFYAVSTAGWKKGCEVALGIFAGFSILMLLAILFCNELSKYIPGLMKYLKYVGAAYILWLAYHIATSKPSESQNVSINFRSGFILSISNIKVILNFITIFTAFIIPTGASFWEMFIHGGVIIFLAAVSWFLWGTAGGLLQRFLARYYRPFNITMGLILVWCAIRIIR